MQSRPIRIDIKDWLESHFEVTAAPFPDVRINCPWCLDDKHRLYVATQNHKDIVKGMCFCHNEQKGYGFFSLFRDHENITDSEATEQLYSDDPEPMYGDAERFLRELEKEEPTQIEEVVPVIWPQGYVRLYGLHPELFQNKIQPYMVQRQLNQQLCDEYRLGYCTHEDFQFGGRIIIPIYQHGVVVGYQGRAMHQAITPKYRFMKGITSGDYLFNLDNISPSTKQVILVEGVFDVWGMKRAGFPNVIASFGKHLTEKGIKTLVSRFDSVIIMWDDDAKVAIAELAERLEGMIEVKVSQLLGKDPDEAKIEDVQDAILNAEIYSRAFYRNALIESIYNKIK